MGKFVVDLTGKRFGRWTVLRMSGRRNQSLWHCRCDCGTEAQAVLYGSLTQGTSTSCGCGRSKVEPAARAQRKRMWSIYMGMKTRCYNVKHPSYKRYGSRGIKMCDAWRESFEAFTRDMGLPPTDAHTLDRFPDNSGNYELGNCRWATRMQQAHNTSANRWHEWQGERRTITDIARMEGVAFCSLRNLLAAGMSPTDAVDRCRARGLRFVERVKHINTAA